MNTKQFAGHTPGPWLNVGLDEDARTICAERRGKRRTVCHVYEYDDLNREANARLIAAAPEGLKVATLAYMALLMHDHDKWRVKSQFVLCALRDFIALATGRTAEEVQTEFEERAAIAKATA